MANGFLLGGIAQGMQSLPQNIQRGAQLGQQGEFNRQRLGLQREGLEQQGELGRARLGLQERQLGLQERQMQQEQQRAQAQEVDSAISGALEFTSEMITRLKEQDKSNEEIMAAISPVIGKVQGTVRSLGGDPTRLTQRIEAQIFSTPSATEEATQAGRATVSEAEAAGRAAGLEGEELRSTVRSSVVGRDSVLEGIRTKLASGEALSEGEQQVYDDALRADPLTRWLMQSQNGQNQSNPPGSSPRPQQVTPSFATEQEVQQALEAGQIEFGDTIIFNGQRVRVNP